jgi:hypothetical protein
MSQVILLIVGAMWAAVLLPPLLRSKIDRPQSSVDVFRRQLHTLQNGVPQRGGYRQPVSYARSGAPLRAMSRPFAPAQPQRRQPATRVAAAPIPGVRTHHNTPSGGIPRSAGPQAMAAYGLSPRELVRRRRQNVFYAVLSANAASLFLAFTTGSTLMIYVFALAFVGLIGYCYMLVQMRQQQVSRQYRRSYYRAA